MLSELEVTAPLSFPSVYAVGFVWCPLHIHALMWSPAEGTGSLCACLAARWESNLH